jgi:hypothetical protein
MAYVPRNSTLYPKWFGRRESTLLVGLLCGCVGILVDIDHVACVLLGIAPLDPHTGEYGCRLWHSYLLPISIGWISVGLALAAGLFCVMVYNAIRTRS